MDRHHWARARLGRPRRRGVGVAVAAAASSAPASRRVAPCLGAAGGSCRFRHSPRVFARGRRRQRARARARRAGAREPEPVVPRGAVSAGASRPSRVRARRHRRRLPAACAHGGAAALRIFFRPDTGVGRSCVRAPRRGAGTFGGTVSAMANALRGANMKRVLLWGLPITLIAALVLWYFGTNYEWVEEEVRTGAKGEARKNDFYGAQLLLEQLGFRVQKVDDARHLFELPVPATLFVSAPQALDDDQASRLAAWVRRGGHLIVPASNSYRRRLFDRFGIKIIGWWHEPKNDVDIMSAHLGDKTLSLNTGEADLLATNYPVLAQVPVSGGKIKWYQRKGPDTGIDDPSEEDADDNAASEDNADTEPDALGKDRQMRDERVPQRAPAFVLHYRVGRGRVTAVGDISLFTNRKIGKHDDAEFLV